MHEETINNLRTKIYATLRPILAGRKCILLDVPYYDNIGDLLIWEGTHCFLNDSKITCLFTASMDTFTYPEIDRNVVILLQGGGNFGDIWIQHQKFRAKVIAHYPHNKIFILPQTVYFEDEAIMKADALELAKHPDLTIIARDNLSYDLLKKFYGTNNIMLLPDMAFCISKGLNRTNQKTGKTLFFKRTDKEVNVSKINKVEEIVPAKAEIHEWPTMEPGFALPIIWRIPLSLSYRFHFNKDIVWSNLVRPLYVKIGVDFINQYDDVFTTRLHGCILSILLGKNITFFDNSYGKNYSFYNTWLKEDKNINFVC